MGPPAHDRARAQGARVRPDHRRAARVRERRLVRARGCGHPRAPHRDARAHGGDIVVDRRYASPRHADADTPHENGRQGAHAAAAREEAIVTAYPITVYYDASCALCRAEIDA